MSQPQRRLQIVHGPDGTRTAVAIGFHPERDREDLDRINTWVQSSHCLLAVEADIDVEHVRA